VEEVRGSIGKASSSQKQEYEYMAYELVPANEPLEMGTLIYLT
jgi:hypothetical protein